MITLEYWENGQLIKSRRFDRNAGLVFLAAFNWVATARNEAARWIIASNGLRN